jgi:Kynureninase
MAPTFTPAEGAEGWQLSNPPVLGLAPLRASLELFDRAGMPALRQKSLQLTGFLESLVQARLSSVLQIITPSEPERRGCQLSLRVRGGREQGRALFEYLHSVGVLGDWREPDVIRISPATALQPLPRRLPLRRGSGSVGRRLIPSRPST